jgi:chloramphenicol-sensitive protein RarD
VLFAVLYYYSTVLQPLDGQEIFAWRVVLSLPALALIISRTKGWGEIAEVGARFVREWRLAFLMMVSAGIIGVQLWLFVWAPLHQKALDVSMGYFLLPMSMAVVGRFLYKERLSRVQTAALAVAGVGVLHELARTGSFSWVTAVVMLGYPPYFVLRRSLRVGSLSALWYDMLLLAPPALFILYAQDISVASQFASFPRLWALVPLLGVISSAALIAYISASRMLPLGLFGILGYVEPVLLFWVAFLFLGEPMAPAAWFTYVPIWLAMLLLAIEGLHSWRREGQK